MSSRESIDVERPESLRYRRHERPKSGFLEMIEHVRISVIIPTCGRAHWLRRAIDSALECASGSIEVIAVPNGKGEDWKGVAATFAGDNRVRFVPVDAMHACAARNAGLRAARGTFVRFLDDDDILFAPGARRQLEVLEASGADICSGAIVSIDGYGRRLGRHPQPSTSDFVAGVLGASRATFTHAHVYRREAIQMIPWAEDLPVGQDVDFLIRVCCARELHWARIDDEVGAWVHHRGSRIYRGKDPGDEALRSQALMLFRARDTLEAQGRLSPARREALADGLWGSFQKGFMRSPRYWLRIADMADAISPGRRPPSSIHQAPLIRDLDPRVVEAALIPPRAVLALFRLVAGRIRHAA